VSVQLIQQHTNWTSNKCVIQVIVKWYKAYLTPSAPIELDSETCIKYSLADIYDTYTMYNPPDIRWPILNTTMSQHYVHCYQIHGLNGVLIWGIWWPILMHCLHYKAEHECKSPTGWYGFTHGKPVGRVTCRSQFMLSASWGGSG